MNSSVAAAIPRRPRCSHPRCWIARWAPPQQQGEGRGVPWRRAGCSRLPGKHWGSRNIAGKRPPFPKTEFGDFPCLITGGYMIGFPEDVVEDRKLHHFEVGKCCTNVLGFNPRTAVEPNKTG